MKNKIKIAMPIVFIIIVSIVVVAIIINHGDNKTKNIISHYDAKGKYSGDYNFTENEEFAENLLVTKSCIINEDNKFITYTDIETGKSMPLCNKPDCTHSDDSCNAKVPDPFGLEFIYYYKNNLYMFGTEENSYKIIQADANGSNRKEVASFEGYDTRSSKIASSNSIYFTYSKDSGLPEDGTNTSGTYSSMENEFPKQLVLAKFDFTTKKAITIYTFPKRYQSNIIIYSIDNDNIYYKYQYNDRPMQDYVDKDDQINESKENKSFHTGIAKINLSTQKNNIIKDDKNINSLKCYNDKIYFIYYNTKSLVCENTFNSLDLTTGKTTKLFTLDLIKQTGDDVSLAVDKDKLIVNDSKNKKIYFYDMTGKRVKTLDNPGFYIIDSCNDIYLVGIKDPWSFSFNYVKKSDIDKKDITVYSIGKPPENNAEPVPTN